jgi:hypothetical protein
LGYGSSSPQAVYVPSLTDDREVTLYQESMSPLRPAEFCRQLLAALGASEGRRKRRKRDTTPDAIGMTIKRDLLERAVQEDPAPESFEPWLMERCRDVGAASGPVCAMAQEIYAEWRLADASGSFREWLTQGAPSDDAQSDS